MPPSSSSSNNRSTRKTAQDIIQGHPVRVTGLVKKDQEVLALVEWTTGLCYIPYDIVKKSFPDQLMKYYESKSVFVKY